MYKTDKLIDKFLTKTISAKEKEILTAWVLKSDSNLQYLKDKIVLHHKQSTSKHFDPNEAFEEFVSVVKRKNKKTTLYVSIFKYAAVFVGLIVGGYLFYSDLFPVPIVEGQVVGTVSKQNPNQIIIQLADGSEKVLHPSANEHLTDDDGKIIANSNEGGLDFSSSKGKMTGEVSLNQIYIPFGQQYYIKLSDGTKVWLNSGTTLKFPQDMAQGEIRKVYLEGEAFFDVVKNQHRPFVVNTQNLNIKVLGTEFNISAYESDEHIATTLVEGSVDVYESGNPDSKMNLVPEDQALFTKMDASFSKRKVNIEVFTAWKDHKLIINRMNFKQLAQILERRHNVKIINNYPSLDDQIFEGKFEQEDISTILNTIALSTPFTHTINNNIVTISK